MLLMPPRIHTILQAKKRKKQTFPFSKTTARIVFPAKYCYMQTVLKSICLISGKDSPLCTLTGLQEKHRKKQESFFFHAHRTSFFFSLCVFLLIQKIFVCKKCRNCFRILQFSIIDHLTQFIYLICLNIYKLSLI